MTVDSPLNVTPAFTFSTVQFSNEVLNTVVASLITVLILVNIGSAISKLVYFSRTTSFAYKSWLRAFIFANSDDPLRIVSWLSRKYVYRDRKWRRYPNKLRLSRLVFPLLARAVILIASIASVAVTVPNERVMDGCVHNDYELKYQPANAELGQIQIPVCRDIPLITDLGEVTSTAAYCFCYDLIVANPSIPGGATTRVISRANPSNGTITTSFANATTEASYFFFVEWKPANSSTTRKTFRSDLPRSLDIRQHSNLVHDAIRASGFVGEEPCNQVGETFVGNDGSVTIDLDCTFRTFEIIAVVEAYVRSAMTWQPIPRGTLQTRVEISDPSSVDGFSTDACPLDLTVTRPLVNIVPLSIMLVIWVVINSIVSFAARKRGNALDAGFHVIKEALGHDCTSNPLEECMEREEVTHVELRKWRCGAGGAHVGFIGREGDVPVEDFDESTIVCGCSRVAVELERAASLATAPVGFGAPGTTTLSAENTQHMQYGQQNGAFYSGTQYTQPASGDGSQWSSAMPPYSVGSTDGAQVGGPAAPPPGA